MNKITLLSPSPEQQAWRLNETGCCTGHNPFRFLVSSTAGPVAEFILLLTAAGGNIAYEEGGHPAGKKAIF